MSNSTVDRDPFPITTAQLLGNFCETLFFGIYLATCTSCVRIFFDAWTEKEERWGRSRKIRWMMTTTALTLFVICTFDTALGLLHNVRAFVDSSEPAQEFQKVSSWINLTRSVNQVVSMIIGDFILVFRCWIVNGRQWPIIIPSLALYIAGLVIAAKLIEIHANPHQEVDQITAWWLSFLAITAVQNTLTSVVMIWRIWRVEKQTETFLNQIESVYQPYRLRQVIQIIAESGAFYTTCVVVTFVVSAIKSNALFPTSDMTLIMTGITFNLILVRSSESRDQQFAKFENDLDRSQLDTRIAFDGFHRPRSIELAGIGLEADRASSRDNLDSVAVTKSVITS
ncbi:hypothetical protein Ac2012v2_8384 [Leucoagaricus gongylophorus]